MPLNREQFAEGLANLATAGVFVGMSLWKDPYSNIYDGEHYQCLGRLYQNQFTLERLAAYAQIFKTVCVDIPHHNFPSQQYLEGMADQAPKDFLFSFTVTDTITL